jgi:hypothetical protein
MTGNQERAAMTIQPTGQQRQNSDDRTAMSGKPGLDRQDTTATVGYPWLNTEPLEQDYLKYKNIKILS